MTPERYEDLKRITKDFTKTWNDIKNTQVLRASLLKDFEKEVIQDHIKKARQNIYRQNKLKEQKPKNDGDIRLLSKRK